MTHIWTHNLTTGCPDLHEAVVTGLLAKCSDGWVRFGAWYATEEEAWAAQRRLNKEHLKLHKAAYEMFENSAV